MYNKHQLSPKSFGIWGMRFVLDYYNSIERNEKLQCKDLVKKNVMLLIILRSKFI